MSKYQKYAFKFLILTLSIVRVTSCSSKISVEELPEVNGVVFYYFAYGSNMLTKDMHSLNPTAVKLGVGELKGYRLDFNTFSDCWDGARATIVPTINASVFGTLWEIHVEHLNIIDDQKSVYKNIHFSKNVHIRVAKGVGYIARTYILVDQPTCELSSFSCNVPEGRQPSKTYLQCLVKGAQETGLPTHYVDWLKSVQHNGNEVPFLKWFLAVKDVELKASSSRASCSDINEKSLDFIPLD